MTVKILDLVQQACNYKQLKKGANEGNYRFYHFDCMLCERIGLCLIRLVDAKQPARHDSDKDAESRNR